MAACTEKIVQPNRGYLEPPRNSPGVLGYMLFIHPLDSFCLLCRDLREREGEREKKGERTDHLCRSRRRSRGRRRLHPRAVLAVATPVLQRVRRDSTHAKTDRTHSGQRLEDRGAPGCSPPTTHARCSAQRQDAVKEAVLNAGRYIGRAQETPHRESAGLTHWMRRMHRGRQGTHRSGFDHVARLTAQQGRLTMGGRVPLTFCQGKHRNM